MRAVHGRTGTHAGPDWASAAARGNGAPCLALGTRLALSRGLRASCARAVRLAARPLFCYFAALLDLARHTAAPRRATA